MLAYALETTQSAWVEHVSPGSARAVCTTAREQTNGTRRFLNIFDVGFAREQVSARLELRRKVRFGDSEILRSPAGVCVFAVGRTGSVLGFRYQKSLGFHYKSTKNWYILKLDFC